jgi:hypothetical protein
MANPVITTLVMKHVEVWDQTMGCSLCGQAWWGERATKIFSDFHADDCELKGASEEHIAADVVARASAYDMFGELADEK